MKAVDTFWVALLAAVLIFSGCGGGGGSSSGDSAPNVAPVANAGPDQTVNEGALVTLNGSGSSDSNGTVTSFSWTEIAGPTVTLTRANTATPSFTAPAVTARSLLTFSLTVTDDKGATSTDSVTVTVNDAPTANAGPDQFVPVQSSIQVTLNGTNSTDSDGRIVSYAWTQLSGPQVNLQNANTATPSFAAPSQTAQLTFRLTAVDDNGAASNDDVTVNLLKLLFSDDFSDGNAVGWTVVDDSGIQSLWQVSNQAYYQGRFVEANPGSFDQSYHTGTYSYLTAGLSSPNYRVSVDVTPRRDIGDPAGSTEGNDCGLMFRYQDPDNYYRISCNSRYGFTRLEKKKNGVFSTLAVNAIGYTDEQPFNVIIDTNGSVIQAYLDGEPLFGAIDSNSVSSGTIALYCQDRTSFDNVVVTENSPAPSIVISGPIAFGVETTNALSVSAVTRNAPDGAAVEFILDGATSVVVSTPPFQATFSNVSKGNHEIQAILRRSPTGAELARDTNDGVGVQGDYYVTVGDSITNGDRDNYSLDNISQDGRIFSVQGYQAKLDDLLTSTRSFPHIVFNEGIGGDSSAAALGRISSILDRHPESNKVLVMLGTIDSGQAVSSTEYQQNMQQLVNSVRGKEVWVALVPPIFTSDGTGTLDPTRDPLIGQYNAVINNSLSGRRVGPDFHSFFRNRFSLFADHLHPNGYGSALMAYLWHNALVGPTDAVPLPLILENLSPANYKQNLLEWDDRCYVDQSFTLASIPSALQNGVWIMTAHADRTNTSQSFLSFNVGLSPTSVFVAYQSGSTPPLWLTNFFQRTNPLLQISVNTGGGLTRFDLYRRDLVTGPVSLGGNLANGASGAQYNYLVIAVKN